MEGNMKQVTDVCKVKLIEFDGKSLPCVSLGTSPFIGAGQFGPKASIYHKMFYLQPANMVKLMVKAWEMGIPSVQLLPYEALIEAFFEAQKATNTCLASTLTIGLTELNKELDYAEALKTSMVFIHARHSDSRDRAQLEKFTRAIEERGLLAGCATHEPDKTLEFIEASDLPIKGYLLPINSRGIWMDKDSKAVLKILERTDKIVIAKKVLAAGKISPQEAFPYLAQVKGVDGLAVGITSEDEAEETLGLALQLWPRPQLAEKGKE